MKLLYILLLLMCNVTITDPQCLKLDLVLLVDVSGSVQGHEYFINNAVKEFITKFKNTDVNIGMITFADNAKIEFHLGDAPIYTITTSGTTDLSDAIDLGVVELFSDRARNGYRKMLLIISDGSPNDINGSKIKAQQSKTIGIGIAGVLINAADSHPDYMKEISDVYVETNFELLSEELLKLNLCI